MYNDGEFKYLCGLSWTTADGKNLRWEQMGDQHLLNCAKLIERRHAEELSAASSMMGRVHGEMATDAVDSELSLLGEVGEQVAAVAAGMRRLVELRGMVNTMFNEEKSKRLHILQNDARLDE